MRAALPAMILAFALFAAPALAFVPPQADQAQPGAAQPATSAAQALKNPAATVEALNKSMRTSEQQNQAAAEALAKAESDTGNTAKAPKARTSKPIYGDIIVHK